MYERVKPGSDQTDCPRTVRGLSVSRFTSVGQALRTGPRTVSGQSADQRTGPTDRSGSFEHVQKLWSVRDLSETCPLYVNRERTGPLSVEAELT